MSAFSKARIEASAALAKEVRATVALPDLSMDGANVFDLCNFIDHMNGLVSWCNETWPAPGIFAERPKEGDPPGVFCRQPGEVLTAISDWADQQIETAHRVLEATTPKGSSEQSFRLEKLLARYACNENFERCRELLMLKLPGDGGVDIATSTRDARDRLDEGIYLLQTSWLALAGNAIDDNFPKDRDAISEVVSQSLKKFDHVKRALEAFSAEESGQ